MSPLLYFYFTQYIFDILIIKDNMLIDSPLGGCRYEY